MFPSLSSNPWSHPFSRFRIYSQVFGSLFAFFVFLRLSLPCGARGAPFQSTETRNYQPRDGRGAWKLRIVPALSHCPVCTYQESIKAVPGNWLICHFLAFCHTLRLQEHFSCIYWECCCVSKDWCSSFVLFPEQRRKINMPQLQTCSFWHFEELHCKL